MYFVGTLDPASTRGGWGPYIVEIVDNDTGEDVDITGARIVVEVRSRRNGMIVLSGTTDNGRVTIVDVGVFQILFPVSDTQFLAPDSYDVGAVLTTASGDVRQLIIGTLPLLDGIVTQ